MVGVAMTSSRRRLASSAVGFVSLVLWIWSLRMPFATVQGTVALHRQGIETAVRRELSQNFPRDAIAGQINTLLQDVVRKRFPIVATKEVFDVIATEVKSGVGNRGPGLVDSVLPSLGINRIKDPPPDVRSIRVLDTIKSVWESGDTVLALALTAFTVFFPLVKYTSLMLLAVSSGEPQRRFAMGVLQRWGQWSMGDVFVVALLVVMLKLDGRVAAGSILADVHVRVYAETGVRVFLASVLLGMVATMLVPASPPVYAVHHEDDDVEMDLARQTHRGSDTPSGVRSCSPTRPTAAR
eukprot:TRINITY_DN10612_c0_g1_i4.p1 TRINITY_DN10612_c0_g1~~TRINITY_DN10612_c0_g1_i4.p1  ORF type:complete len:296 (+),score=86.24 TRINITY_DN10612_c0_g1_i4:59-946(+)